MVLGNPLLKGLIDSGADAQSNLFIIRFNNGQERGNYTYRTNKFDAPELGINTTKLPYINNEVEITVPGTKINKQLSFNFRLDSNFELYKELKESMEISELGDWNPNNGKLWTIEVEALNPTSSEENPNSTIGYHQSTYMWKFTECKVIYIPPIPFTYNASQPLNIQVKFIWGNYTSGSTSEVSSIIRQSPN